MESSRILLALFLGQLESWSFLMSKQSPLGVSSGYTDNYDPKLLFAILRSKSRATLGLGSDLPFHGEDIWNAYELTWLDQHGKPRLAMAELRIPANSKAVVESKSLKLYVNSFSGTQFKDSEEVRNLIIKDLSELCSATVEVQLVLSTDSEFGRIGRLPGFCIDSLSVTCEHYEVDPGLLKLQVNAPIVQEELYTNLLRSKCPVTSQPDLGSILITYSGPQIEPSSLLRYIISYRNHEALHETCVENVFLDIMDRCQPDKLSVYARYLRRGGIDINPFRSNFETHVRNVRLSRQ